MSSEPDKILEDVAGEWSDHFDRSIRSESVRAKVILSACYLDELLRQLIEIVLKPNEEKTDPLLEGPNAPLNTFNAKIELATRMGLISEKDKKSFHLIRKIRNAFAHKLTKCDFSDKQVLAWNEELHKLNDIASPQRRLTFSLGPVGDFEKSVSWLIYFLKHSTLQIKTQCPGCGSEMEHRIKLKNKKPEDH